MLKEDLDDLLHFLCQSSFQTESVLSTQRPKSPGDASKQK
jgi:hypothetical protein